MPYTHLSVSDTRIYTKRPLGEYIYENHARELRRSPSSILRELKRNFPEVRYVYAPRQAHERALKKRKSHGRELRLKNETVRSYVIIKLKLGWSPEQVVGRIERELPGESISHEAIYQYVYAQVHREGHGYIKPGREDLRPYLARRRKRRQ